MNNLNQKLIIEQLDRKFEKLINLNDLESPSQGWIKSIRKALNMSLKQLANKLNITSVSVKETEQREQDKGITLKKLSEVAEALDCRLVYAIIPKQNSLEKIIEKRAYKFAEEIVFRTSHTMKLEDQENTPERLQKAIKNRAEKIKNEMPRYLWD
jgi:predicted DNA-binding mobile mystery protein A